VLLCKGEQFVIRAARGRGLTEPDEYPYSRTIIRRALDEGVGILSEDVGRDEKLVLSATLLSLNLRSFLCVPLIGGKGDRLGVIQLDCVRPGQRFHDEDLEMLTAISLQAAVVMENLSLHAERLRQERLRQEIALAREIQQSYLPTDFGPLADSGIELFARVNPAREVSGDLYDFFRLPDGRLAFFLGDVSGKGMPAALFMIAVRTLCRHLAAASDGPADMLTRLNAALVSDNQTSLFVTLVHGVYDPHDGALSLSTGGHPPPLLRRASGTVEEIPLQPGPLLGYSPLPPKLQETHLTLGPGETIVLYTDGFTEAFGTDNKTQFGLDRLRTVLGVERTGWMLERCADFAEAAVRAFTEQDELQDDQTLLLLRRR
jgi:serine phosphatase RsbU (regulator of sigma subunit)